jgi:diaminopimelate epimerase
MRLVKAHAYGNDFLYARGADVAATGLDPVALARRVCDRHTGVGADGLILFSQTDEGARMRLLNADGSHSEVSGNGVRGLGALLARERGMRFGAIGVHTDAGLKRLQLLEADGGRRFLFRADMGVPTDIATRRLEVAGETIDVVALRVGNPQCVLLAPLDEARLHRLGAALQRHEAFPEAVNFEMAQVGASAAAARAAAPPDQVHILIWERGVGPTQSSGTGSCAAAVAAIVAGGAARKLTVRAPGGEQLVEWPADTEPIHLTGWAEIVFEGDWIA